MNPSCRHGGNSTCRRWRPRNRRESRHRRPWKPRRSWPGQRPGRSRRRWMFRSSPSFDTPRSRWARVLLIVIRGQSNRKMSSVDSKGVMVYVSIEISIYLTVVSWRAPLLLSKGKIQHSTHGTTKGHCVTGEWCGDCLSMTRLTRLLVEAVQVLHLEENTLYFLPELGAQGGSLC